MRLKVHRAFTEVVPDSDPDPSYLYQDGLGFEERRAQYEQGDFGFVGVRTVAELHFEENDHTIVGQFVRTPGIWGIEDDSGDEYIKETAKDEAAVLTEMLAALGVERWAARYAGLCAPLKVEHR